MKLQDVRSTYYELSGKTSDLVRQLGFAGIALIWLFKTDIAGQPRIPGALVVPGLLIVVALTLDLLQYVAGTLIWGMYNRQKERAGSSPEEEFTAHPALNWPTLVCFWGKVVLMSIAYALLILFLARILA
jgi:hypothetical protein